jgi:hypothetical protein
MNEDEVRKLRSGVRQVAHELALWSADVLEEGGFFDSHEDLATRLATLGKRLMDALNEHRRPDDPDPSFETPG